jgi:sialidase-1
MLPNGRGAFLSFWLPCSCGLLLAFSVDCGHSAEPFLEKTNLFQAGQDGITLYRIPGIIVTTNDTVVIYCEARRNSRSDWADSQVFLRRSTDAGKSFGSPHPVAHLGERLARNPIALKRKEGNADDQTVNNPVAITDQQTGDVHFLYCVNYQRCFYLRSSNDALTFSKPREITSAFDEFRPEYEWRVIATGPGHGIQLRNGRLLVPVWLSTGDSGHSPSVAATIYSDDHGRTWHRGAIALLSAEAWPNPNETAAVQLADGRVLLNIRTDASRNRRVITTSPDGIARWTPARFDDALLEPVCMASLARYSIKTDGGKNRLLFSNPDNLEGGKDPATPGSHRARKNLSIKLSYDEGQTWPVSKPLEKGTSAYSDLAVLRDGTILCFYERGTSLALARFNLEWLTNGRDSPKQ